MNGRSEGIFTRIFCGHQAQSSLDVLNTSPEVAGDSTLVRAVVHAQTLSTIASGTSKQSGWYGATSSLGLFGLNTTNPLGEWLRGDKLVGVMKEVPGEVLEFRRPPHTHYRCQRRYR